MIYLKDIETQNMVPSNKDKQIFYYSTREKSIFSFFKKYIYFHSFWSKSHLN